MFARLEFVSTLEKKQEFAEKVKGEILPVLKSQKGFLDILSFFPETATHFGRCEKVLTISLWAEKADADKYEREVFPAVQEVLKPYLMTPTTIKSYLVDVALSEHFRSNAAV